MGSVYFPNTQNFVKVTFLLKKLLELFDEIFCETKSYIFPLCGGIYSHNFSMTVSRKKCCESAFLVSPQHWEFTVW